MNRLLYNAFIFLFAFCHSQTNNTDIYFLDMGVAIEPKNYADKTARLIKPSLNANDKNTLLSLKQMYYMNGDYKKSEEMKKLIESLK